MQKLNEKKILGTVPKKLQLVETFWDCPEFSENKQKQKGITLIALIITIIVMLILVGVTINVALNGGLFTKAEEATRATEKDAIYEQIVNNMEITDNGKIAVKETFDKVLSDFGADKITNINPATVDANTTEVTFNVTGKTGTYSYKISTTKIEKDIAQEPQQTGGLVYGRIYKGLVTDGEETIEASIAFSKRLGVMFVDDIYNFVKFEYSEETNNITAPYTQFTVIENGTKLTGTIDELEGELPLTEENMFEKYQPALDNENNIYMGMYYNEDIGTLISIEYDSGEYKCMIEGYEYRAGSLEIVLERASVTIVDSKNLSYEGNTYTLVEELE